MTLLNTYLLFCLCYKNLHWANTSITVISGFLHKLDEVSTNLLFDAAIVGSLRRNVKVFYQIKKEETRKELAFETN